MDFSLPIHIEIVFGELDDTSVTIESSDEIHTSTVVFVLVQKARNLVVWINVVAIVDVLVVPLDFLSISVDLENLQVVQHNEGHIVVRETVVLVSDIMVDGSISHVPWDVCIRGSNLLERNELEDSSIDGVQLHDHGH